jgi:hypothetical protein
VKQAKWYILLAVSLISLSVALYFVHYLIFRDAHHIFLYLLGDIAFIPVDVLLVVIIIHRLLAIRDKQAILNKLNMVVGAFFSEVGGNLLKAVSRFDRGIDDVRARLVVKKEWSRRDFAAMRRSLAAAQRELKPSGRDLTDLKGFLVTKRRFLLALLENPNLLEHDRFTDLLWAIFHLTEELEGRKDLTSIPAADAEHLANDIKRCYGLLLLEWLIYMEHLSRDYPYLFSLALRTNPFDPAASVIIKG